MYLANSAEGGVQGTTVTPANSGGASGQAWDAVALGGTSLITFDNTNRMHGSFAYKCARDATQTDATTLSWNGAGGGGQLGAGATEMWFRMYVLLGYVPPPGGFYTQLIAAAHQSVSFDGGCVVVDTGTQAFLRTQDSVGDVSTGTVPIPTGQWFRVEQHIIASATVGVVEARLYLSPDSVTFDEQLTASNRNTGTLLDGIAYGPDGNQAASATTPVLWMDDLALSTNGWIGPSVVSSPAFLRPPGGRGAAWMRRWDDAPWKRRRSGILVPA